jgi:hypothetical protein
LEFIDVPEVVKDKGISEDDFMNILDWCDVWIIIFKTNAGMFWLREHKSISSRNRLMFCLSYGLIQSDKNKKKIKK